ncbi:hypothetical protein Tco_1157260 [Tanacetum coccineum]
MMSKLEACYSHDTSNEHQLTIISIQMLNLSLLPIETRYEVMQLPRKTHKNSLEATVMRISVQPSAESLELYFSIAASCKIFIRLAIWQIHQDDLEALDFKWQALCASDTLLGSAEHQEARKVSSGNQGNTKKQGNNEDTSSKAMLAIDGVGFDWSDMAEEQVQTNMALMAFSDSEVYTDKTCSKTCLKNYETLKKQCDDLLVKLNESEFKATTYKRGLATLEDQIIIYKKIEVLFSEEVAVLKREVGCKNYEINVPKSELEKVKQEKDGIGFKIEKFNNASKDLDQLPNKLDLSYSGLDEFKEPEFKGYGPENSKQESNVVCEKESDNSKENSNESLVKEQVSQDKSSFVESLPNVDKETIFPANKKVEFTKPENHEKSVKKSVRSVHEAKRHYYTGRHNAVNTARSYTGQVNVVRGKPQHDDKGLILLVKHVEYLMLNASPFEVMFEKKVNGLGSHLIKTRLGISKEVGTPRYLSLVVPLRKVGDEAVHKKLGNRMEMVATTASS